MKIETCGSWKWLSVLALLFFLPGAARAQQVSGSVVGTVVDPAGSPVPGAEVTITDVEIRTVRSTQTDVQGNFAFNAMPPGTYTLAVAAKAFRRLVKTNIVLPASERLALGNLQLVLGQVSETVSVTAQGANVQTASSERSGVITSSQVQDLAVADRNFSVLVSLQPGVASTVPPDTTGYSGNMSFYSVGGRATDNNFTLDGLPVNDLGAAVQTVDFVSMDSVREVKILVSNFQAEFGRKPGASVQAVTKSGSAEFHGTAYWYQRNEDLNANNFFNNRSGLPNPIYRYITAGANIGGPVYIPRKFNRAKNKLFFFFAEEQLRELRPQPILNLTMPTAAERQGDFSHSLSVKGTLIPVKDPTTGQVFPGNIIPASRLNPAGQGFLNAFPLPNFTNTALSGNAYNYQFQESLNAPKHNETARVDYNVTPKIMLYARFNNWVESQQGYAVPAGGPAWPWIQAFYNDANKTGVADATILISPTAVLEVSSGYMRWQESNPLSAQAAARVSRTATGIGIPQFYPQYNPLGLLPQATFGGISDPPSITYDGRFPITGLDREWTWNATLAKTYNGHIVKLGIWAERTMNNKGPSSNFAGTYDFSTNVNNPLDSGDAYANAMLGNFNSYTESTTRPAVAARSPLVEWFAQDTWKVNKRLTLDLGVRFGWCQPYFNKGGQLAGFNPSLWDPSQAVKLIQPAIVSGQRVGRDPVTGAILPAAYIGADASAGNPTDGTVYVKTNPSYPEALRYASGIKTAPRFGFAYDPFGKGKTAIRGGFGIFYEMREMGIRQFNTYSNPPVEFNPTIYYGNMNTLLNSSGATFPSATTGFSESWPVARTMDISFGVQQDIGFQTVLDVAYVGALGRDLQYGQNLNAIPFGADFAPALQDPTTPGKPLPAAFQRPYPGYNNISYYSYGTNSSYHSLQVSANRRFARGIQFGLAWTWSKTMDYNDTNLDLLSTLIDPRIWNYGEASYDHTHILKISFTYDIPKASNLWHNAAVRGVLDNWQLSGIVTMQSGAPLGITLAYVTPTDVTGSSTDGARVNVVQNPILSKSQRTFAKNFNTAAFQAPAIGTPGDAARDEIRGPGLNDWDLSLFKNIPLIRERLKMQLRGEFYNAFNHTQFTTWNTTATFDAQGNQANSLFGQATAAAPARRIQLALRLSF
ncbi:MAG TPA: carboxypeptidase-like regulatory domain-containing protein [Bryobacteraceae bacterium]|nr:carboxypeptidase-like regulatory domain-containing protein [Bryobacteraceae bacterium]